MGAGGKTGFAWHWLADLCEDQSIPFTLGHALYMKAVHGGAPEPQRGAIR